MSVELGESCIRVFFKFFNLITVNFSHRMTHRRTILYYLKYSKENKKLRAYLIFNCIIQFYRWYTQCFSAFRLSFSFTISFKAVVNSVQYSFVYNLKIKSLIFIVLYIITVTLFNDIIIIYELKNYSKHIAAQSLQPT